MRFSIFKRRSAGLLALIMVFSLLFGTLQGSVVTQAATKDYYIKVNKGTNVVTVYTTKDNEPYVAFVCSAGYATPLGTFETPAKYRWWTLDGPSYGQYCTRITGGILFHSVWYYSQTKNSQAYAQYNKLGTLASHGCVRLTVAAAKWIYENCPLGTKVTIFNGTAKDDPLGKPEAIKVSASKRMGWDPTDPDKDNPYKTKSTKPKFTISAKVLALGSDFAGGNMTCKDSGGFDITGIVKQQGNVDMNTVGDYSVIYSVIDSFGRTASKTVTYKVRDINAPMLSGVKAAMTKAYGSTKDLKAGLKAENYAGDNLTSKIKVYIKAPGSSEYIEYTDDEYTFDEVGKYQLKYQVTNPANKKKTTVKATITVIDSQKPVLQSEDDWSAMTIAEEAAVMTRDELMAGVTAALQSGADLTDSVIVKVTDADGTTTKIGIDDTYQFMGSGRYLVTYTVKNPTKNTKTDSYMTTKMTREIVVGSAVQDAETVQPEDSVNE